MMMEELTIEQVKWTCDPAIFHCDSTADMKPLAGIIGQDRALKALEFGLGINEKRFNIFVSGIPGTGRTTTIKAFLDERAAKKPVPPDCVYVYNFKDSYSPCAIELPPGMGKELKKDMMATMENASRSIAQAMSSKEYTDRREEITQGFNRHREQVFNDMQDRAKKAGFILQATPAGLAFIMAPNGKPVTEKQWDALSEAEKAKVSSSQEELNKILQEELSKLRVEETNTQQKLDQVEKDTAGSAIGYLFDNLEKKYVKYTEVTEFLKDVRKDITDSLDIFETPPPSAVPQPYAAMQEQARKQEIHKYEINVFVDNSELKGAPVVIEYNPTYPNLFGRMEREAQFGALYTDFTLLKPGALHKANGGYLVVRIQDIAMNPASWESLKRAIREGKLLIEDITERLGYVTVKTLTPESIPLSAKILIIGDPMIYSLLYTNDSEFKELFKVKADFDTTFDRTDKNLQDYAAVLCRICHEEHLKDLKSDAIAKIIEYSVRLAEDQYKLSSLFASVVDILREANFWANQDNSQYIEAKHVKQAIDQKTYRSNLIQQHIEEMIKNGQILIDTKDAVPGQLNGLSVISVGDYDFGQPSRITASVGVGRQGVIDIERESKLSGATHTKGVMILSGFLENKFAQKFPLTLSARIVFEQSYGGVDGDSASSGELYTLLSRIANVPVKQNIACTGSINQRGEVQPIGGANEKIEGFFEVCKRVGLTGMQGVCIPASNIRNLQLKDEVVEAIKDKKFHIYPVKTVDEGIEVMTGMKAGKQLADGSFEPDTVNDLIQKNLQSKVNIIRRLSFHDGDFGPEALLPERSPAMADEEDKKPAEKKPANRKRKKQ
jgi:predicted ATP-dependent protease